MSFEGCRHIVILREEDGTERSYDLAIPKLTPPAIVVTEDRRPYLLTDKSKREPGREWIYEQPSWTLVRERRSR